MAEKATGNPSFRPHGPHPNPLPKGEGTKQRHPNPFPTGEGTAVTGCVSPST